MAPPAQATLSDRRSVTTSGLEWSIDVWATPSFGAGVGILDQRLVWLAGVAVTAMAMAAAAWRDKTKRRLDDTVVELAQVRSQALTDGLTGLLNRSGLIDSARDVADHLPAALFFVDLDGFKAINDTDGHHQGDEVLIDVADRLRALFRPDDLVSRLGGDEFVVFTTTTADDGYVEAISARITSSIDDIDSRITASVGVATRPGGVPIDIKELLRAADEAMYEAKRAGGDRCVMRERGR